MKRNIEKMAADAKMKIKAEKNNSGWFKENFSWLNMYGSEIPYMQRAVFVEVLRPLLVEALNQDRHFFHKKFALVDGKLICGKKPVEHSPEFKTSSDLSEFFWEALNDPRGRMLGAFMLFLDDMSKWVKMSAGYLKDAGIIDEEDAEQMNELSKLSIREELFIATA